MTLGSELFPPFPLGLKGRRAELSTLSRLLAPARPGRLALVGSGGSGKSMLACALGYRLAAKLPGGIHWLRSGPWDARTLGEMLALRFGSTRERGRLFPALRERLTGSKPLLVVLDNHENDRAVAAVLNELEGANVRWVITARRCLLGGVTIFPVIAPLATTGKSAFPRVRALSALLRHNPLALDIADAVVSSGAVVVADLRAWLLARGIQTVRIIDHEDDLPEVALLVDWAWDRLSEAEHRILAVLAHAGGDHVDAASLLRLAGVRKGSAESAMPMLLGWRLVQQPFPSRYALHAVVRYAIVRRTRFDRAVLLEHYLDLLESNPARLDLEQTHLYAAMDFAHNESKLDWMLRIEALLAKLGC